eukprot:COSAG01_NODE_8387_length_2804_cov_118.059519_2_plen_584_part_00
MSLICLTNTNSQPSNSFQNDFTNTFEIESNSEVALHSIAFNRMPLYDISQKFFYVYHGVPVEEDTYGGDLKNIFSSPSEIRLSDGGYTSAQLVEEVERALKANDRHPNYQSKWTATAKVGGDNSDQFQGITIECDQLAPPAKTDEGHIKTITPPSGIVGLSEFDLAHVVYDEEDGTIDRKDGDEMLEVFCRTLHPMNLNDGEFIVNFSEYLDPESSSIPFDNQIGYGRDYNLDDTLIDDTFLDVYVSIDDGHGGDGFKAGDIHVYQMEQDDDNGYKINDVVYYSDGSVVIPDPDSAYRLLEEPMNILNPPEGHQDIEYDSFRFVFDNEAVTIYLGNSEQQEWEVLAKTSIKATSFATCAVYPKMKLTSESVIQILHQDEVASYTTPELTDYTRSKIIDADRMNDNHSVGCKTIVSGPSEQAHLDYHNVIISGHVDITTYYGAPFANMSRIFGYKDMVVQTVVKAEDSAKSTFQPTLVDIPQFVANTGQSITFVRLSSLTQKSLNGMTKSLSSIICDVPRYLLNGQTYGRLYYAPPEKTYLKLHNEEKFNINRLSLELTNVNELLVNDLVGQTTVLLHIRKTRE